MESEQRAIKARIGLYSGRRDPELTIDGSAAEELAGLIKETVGKEPTHAPPPARLGVYHGFLVQTPSDLAQRLGIPREFRAYRGVVSVGVGREEHHWRDVGVERYLLERAFRDEGHGAALKEAGVTGEAAR